MKDLLNLKRTLLGMLGPVSYTHLDPAYDADIPQMGDEGNLALWTSLLLLGGMAAVGMAFFLRRKAAR